MKLWEHKFKWLGTVVAAVLAVILLVVFLRRDKGPLEVPLGVEHALALTYAGPELVVEPFGYGVAVSLRIAAVHEHDGRRTYDIRYMLNRGGTYSITDYLTTVEGADPVGLPAFPVVGLETLSDGVDRRIQELREVRIEFWHYYHETMAVVIALWLLWLGLILFWPRKQEEIEPAPGPPIDLFPARLRDYLTQAAQGTLNQTDKARLEMMMIDHWRLGLPTADLRMHATVRRIGDDPRYGKCYHALVDWIHNPSSSVSSAQLVELLSPFTRANEKGEPA